MALWNSYLFLISNNVWAISSLGDLQITFITLNRFCPLSKPHRVVNHLLFLTDRTKLDDGTSKIEWKIHVLVHYILSFKVLLIKEYKIKLVCQFLYFLFYIASEFTSVDIIFNIRWETIFASNYNWFTQTHHPLAKHDKSFSLMLLKFGKFLGLYLGCDSMT